MLDTGGAARVSSGVSPMRITLLLCGLVLVCTGCPEPPIAGRIVSLNFPSREGESAVTLSVSDPETVGALKVVDEALVSHGFVRDSNPPEMGLQGFIASYSRPDKYGLIPLGDQPLLWFQHDRLDIVFSEGRVPGGHISAPTKATIDMLRTELINHYGSKRVRVEHGPG